MERSTVERIGDVEQMVTSFRRHLRAENKAEQTITAYTYAPMQLAEFLTDKLECPNCHADLAGSIDRVPSRAKRGPREQHSRTNGSNAPVRREFRSRDEGVSLPSSSTEVPHRNPGINGMEVGTAPGCVRCERYGSDHVGDHIKAWGEVA